MSSPGLLCDECSNRYATCGMYCNECASERDARAQGYQDARAAAEAKGRVDAAAFLRAIDHPAHYTSHPSGIECIEVTAHMGFCLGNAIKYIWRADEKDDAIQDLRKAMWYIQKEIDLREGGLK